MDYLMEIQKNEDKKHRFWEVFKDSEMYAVEMNPERFNWINHTIRYNILDDGECHLIKAHIIASALNYECTKYFVTTDCEEGDREKWLEKIIKQHFDYFDIKEIKLADCISLNLNGFMEIMKTIASDKNYITEKCDFDEEYTL